MTKNIFKVTKRHTNISHTDCYYLNKDDCEWFLDCRDYRMGLLRISLIQVEDTDNKYEMAKDGTERMREMKKIYHKNRFKDMSN